MREFTSQHTLSIGLATPSSTMSSDQSPMAYPLRVRENVSHAQMAGSSLILVQVVMGVWPTIWGMPGAWSVASSLASAHRGPGYHVPAAGGPAGG